MARILTDAAHCDRTVKTYYGTALQYTEGRPHEWMADIISEYWDAAHYYGNMP